MFSLVKTLAMWVIVCLPYSYPNKILDIRFYALVSQIPTTIKFLNITAILVLFVWFFIINTRPVRPTTTLGILAAAYLSVTIYKTCGIYGAPVREFNLALRNPLNYLHPPALAMLVTSIILLNSKRTSVLWHNATGTQLHLFGLNYVTATLTMLLSTLLSMWWAQQELFWGTFWNWDPVELSMAALLFLFVGILHINVAGAQTKLGAATNSGLLCVGITLIYFHNKSNLIGSIHAFANNTMAKLSEQLIGLIFTAPLLHLTVGLFGLCLKLAMLRLGGPNNLAGITALLTVPAIIFGTFLANAVVGGVHFSYPTAKSLIFIHVSVATLRPRTVSGRMKFIISTAKRTNHQVVLLLALITCLVKVDLLVPPLLTRHCGTDLYSFKSLTSHLIRFSGTSTPNKFVPQFLHFGSKTTKSSTNFWPYRSKCFVGSGKFNTSLTLLKKKNNLPFFIKVESGLSINKCLVLVLYLIWYRRRRI